MKKFLFCLLILSAMLLISCGTAKQDDTEKEIKIDGTKFETVAEANNALGFDVLTRLKTSSKENIFISPYSLFMALSMVYNGADGETKTEIEKVLHIKGSLDELNDQNKELFNYLNQDRKDVQLQIANSIWLNHHFHFQDSFRNNLKNFYDAKIEEVDISSEKTVKEINNWVKKQTNGKIDEIAEHPLDPQTVTMILNAIYFKGDWLNEFDNKLTEDRDFYLSDKSSVKVPLMQQKNDWLYYEDDEVQMVSLPYKNETLSMKVILPKEGTKDLNSLLTKDNWEKWHEASSTREGTVLLPKFQLDYEVELNNVLKQLGMESAFNENANFSKIIEETNPLQISQVKQVSYLDVNEEGTEAAAVTSIVMETSMAIDGGPFYMEVNRPFFLAIVDETTKAILFMGFIENPSS